MAQGDCERTFQFAAARDGITLARASVPWINQRGHLGLPSDARPVMDVLTTIFLALGGDTTAQAAKHTTRLPGDFVHQATGTFIEVDESQHFTSFRRTTLDLYPPDLALGFDLDEYKLLCDEWAARSDKFRASKPAIGFGPGGRQRQRAYNDALRDLVTPTLGHPPTIRVAAPDRDGAAAYQRVRERLHHLSKRDEGS